MTRSTPEGDHLPVMAEEILAFLDPQPSETMADCTLGTAGHAKLILPKITPAGRYLGFDLDPNANEKAQSKLQPWLKNFSFHHGNFAGIASAMFEHNINKFDMVLADLGVSSPQIDDPQRGFSYMRPGPLDMRMDPTRNHKLSDLLAKTTWEELAVALKEFGDVSTSDSIAKTIISSFKQGKINTTTDLANCLLPFHPNKTKSKNPKLRPVNLLAQVFQALRIMLNREIENLKALLRAIPSIMKPGARIAIISFHSGEDRLVKKAFEHWLRDGFLADITPEPVRPCYGEISSNPRSRSAKLRCATVKASPELTSIP